VWVLVAARMVQGLGGALLLPTSLNLILPEFSGGAAERPWWRSSAVLSLVTA
jgi:MFS family permease